jgi:hypothetical protein
VTFNQCAAFKPNGERCKRAALEGSDYCYSHRLCDEEKPPAIQPLPQDKIRPISSNAWAFCEFCHDAYPMADLRADGNGKLACRGCYFLANVLRVTKPEPGEDKRFLAASQAAELARQKKLSFDEAFVELLEWGFKLEEHFGYLFFVKSEA